MCGDMYKCISINVFEAKIKGKQRTQSGENEQNQVFERKNKRIKQKKLTFGDCFFLGVGLASSNFFSFIVFFKCLFEKQ